MEACTSEPAIHFEPDAPRSARRNASQRAACHPIRVSWCRGEERLPNAPTNPAMG